MAYFSHGLPIFDGKYGFIDITGRYVIPLNYKDAHNFSNGIAQVLNDGKWIYIDLSGKE